MHFERSKTPHVRMYTVDVQTTVFFIVIRLIVGMLQGGSECRMKSGKELCTNIRLRA